MTIKEVICDHAQHILKGSNLWSLITIKEVTCGHK